MVQCVAVAHELKVGLAFPVKTRKYGTCAIFVPMYRESREERVLAWLPPLMPGEYTVQARLIYDLNRYNDRTFTENQTEMYRASLAIKVRRGQ